MSEPVSIQLICSLVIMCGDDVCLRGFQVSHSGAVVSHGQDQAAHISRDLAYGASGHLGLVSDKFQSMFPLCNVAISRGGGQTPP